MVKPLEIKVNHDTFKFVKLVVYDLLPPYDPNLGQAQELICFLADGSCIKAPNFTLERFRSVVREYCADGSGWIPNTQTPNTCSFMIARRKEVQEPDKKLALEMAFGVAFYFSEQKVDFFSTWKPNDESASLFQSVMNDSTSIS